MFKDQNKEWLESLGVKHGNLEVQLIQGSWKILS
jgi:hypothetical protein